MDRPFLDANVLFAAAYRADSALARLWKLKRVELLTSAYALEEAKINLTEDAQRVRLARLARSLKIVPESRAEQLPKGVQLPDKDQPVMLAAIQAQATHLLTRDAAHFGAYFGKTIAGMKVGLPGAYLREKE